jgi:hypothetical protein
VLPVLVPMAETDATVRAAIVESYLATPYDGGQAATTGVEGSALLEARGRGTSASLSLSALYARALTIVQGLAPIDPNVFGATVASRATVDVTPSSRLFAEGTAYAASTFGVRAEDALAARDPFLTDRLEYAVGAGLGWTEAMSRRATLTLTGGYLQSGGLLALTPDAVGVDSHLGRVGVALAHEVGKRDRAIIEVRGTAEHFYHALIDTNLDRAPADVRTGTLLVTDEHAFGRRSSVTLGGGVTVATPPPEMDTGTLVVSPALRAGFLYRDREWRGSLTYSFDYASLGPRIGYGTVNAGVLELALRPMEGARSRGFVVRLIGRGSYGIAPVLAVAPVPAPGAAPGPPSPASSATGALRTLTLALGGHVDLPIARGLLAQGGVDVELMRATADPPTDLPMPPTLQVIASIGLAAVASTNPLRRLPLDPADEPPDVTFAPPHEDVGAPGALGPAPDARPPSDDDDVPAAPPP